MQRLTTRLITQEIEQNSIERYELRMVLRPIKPLGINSF